MTETGKRVVPTTAIESPDAEPQTAKEQHQYEDGKTPPSVDCGKDATLPGELDASEQSIDGKVVNENREELEPASGNGAGVESGDGMAGPSPNSNSGSQGQQNHGEILNGVQEKGDGAMEIDPKDTAEMESVEEGNDSKQGNGDSKDGDDKEDGRRSEKRKDRERDKGRNADGVRSREGDHDRARHRDKHRDRERDKDKDKERDKHRNRDRKERRRDRDKGREADRDRGRRVMPRRDRGGERDWGKGGNRERRAGYRSSSRRRRHHSRSASPNPRKRHSRSLSKSRKRTRRSRPKDRRPRGSRSISESSGRRGRRSRSASGDYGGYVPRRRQEPPQPGAGSSNDGFFGKVGDGSADPQEALRHWQEQQLRSRQLILQQQAASAVAAAKGREGFSPLPCPTRQVYVGNLVPGLVSESALCELFNSALSAAFPESTQPGMEPVISVSMHSDGRYAFVELRTPEMATSALQLSGQVQLFGQSISVGRPSGYVDPSKAAAAAQAAAAALAAFQAGDPKSGPSTGSGGSGQMGMVKMGMLTGSALAASPASAFICIDGMITLDTLTSDDSYRTVIADLRNECVRHGAVIQLKIPRPADPKMAQLLFGTGFYGKAFVQFSDATSATRAREALNGQPFGTGQVGVTFVSQEVFAAII